MAEMKLVALKRVDDHMGTWYVVAYDDYKGRRWIAHFKKLEEALDKVKLIENK